MLQLNTDVGGLKEDVGELKANMLQLNTDVGKLKTDFAENFGKICFQLTHICI